MRDSGETPKRGVDRDFMEKARLRHLLVNVPWVVSTIRNPHLRLRGARSLADRWAHDIGVRTRKEEALVARVATLHHIRRSAPVAMNLEDHAVAIDLSVPMPSDDDSIAYVCLHDRLLLELVPAFMMAEGRSRR